MKSKSSQLERLLAAAHDGESRGAWDEALQLYEEAFGRLTSDGDAATAAELLRRIGRVHRERGDIELAVEAFEASLAIAEAAELRDQTAQALNSLGGAEQRRGRLHEAEPLFVQARQIAMETCDQQLLAKVEQNLGVLSNIRGDLVTALALYRSALDRQRLLDDDLTAAHTLNNMGMAYVDLESWREAESCFDEGARLAASAGDAHMLGTIHMNRAELHLKRQHYEEARECCQRAYDIFSTTRSRSRLAEVYKFLGVLHRDTGKGDLAQSHFALSLGLAQSADDRLLKAETQSEWAMLHLEHSRHREALRCLNRAHAGFAELRARREVLDIERRLERLKARYLPAVETWAVETLERRDLYLNGHCSRVADYSHRLGSALGVEGWDLTWLWVGALVHDVGKSAVPCSVLQKPGRLSGPELEIARSHTVLGESMIAELDFPSHVQPLVRNHHEHWDGSGYPDRLHGEEIPLGARILGLADAFDALTTDRSHRARYSPGEALRIMRSEAGTTFDPHLLETFGKLVAV